MKLCDGYLWILVEMNVIKKIDMNGVVVEIYSIGFIYVLFDIIFNNIGDLMFIVMVVKELNVIRD